MKEFFKAIAADFYSICSSKTFLYSGFFSLWTIFFLYNSNFFHPFYFWISYSFLVMFIVPVYFIIAVEENDIKIKALFSFLFVLAVIFSFYLVNLKGSKRLIEKNELLSGLLIISLLPVILYSFLKKRFFLSDYGLSRGLQFQSFVVTVVFSVFAVLIAWGASFNPQFKNIYPLIGAMKQGGGVFIKYQIGFFIFFFLWEFFFRGAMLFSFIRSSENAAFAIILQSCIFAFAHLGKPGIETVSSFFGGIILGIAVYRLKTFAPAAIVHFILALTMDLMAVFFR